MSLLDKKVTHLDFENGYSASLIYWPNGELEVAVLVDGKPVYNTPITGDVIRCNAVDAWKVITDIQKLPKRVVFGEE